MQEFAPEFPFLPDAVRATLAQVMMTRGRAREVSYLTFGKLEPVYLHHDNFDGGVDFWSLILRTPSRIYALASKEEIDRSEKDLLGAAQEVMKGVPCHRLIEFQVAPALGGSTSWEQDMRRYLNSEGVTNQGRVRSDNVAPLEYEGLYFRSQPEIHLFKALKAIEVTMAPLPVFVRGGRSYRRIEPDFIGLPSQLFRRGNPVQ